MIIAIQSGIENLILKRLLISPDVGILGVGN
jgi:hypothetical protein